MRLCHYVTVIDAPGCREAHIVVAEKHQLPFSFQLLLPAKVELHELKQLKANWLDANSSRDDVPLILLWLLVVCNTKHHTSWSCCLQISNHQIRLCSFQMSRHLTLL